ncbi:DUF4097 family beta strand repeat-containing protein [Paenibacillus sanguinis]|uniref:DUF4097 family beta strand repeat-containing protein n=1 Tax=Paenibacillus sanguinis TaxID=225906 RepID=UPI000376E918|nr:DUF4097 family beta strand repeat-containing protein [Paenibacillus sanguinis]
MKPDMLSPHQDRGLIRAKGFAPRRRKRKAVACLLSALFPGLGHLYLRLFIRGLSMIYFVLIDVSAMIYFSSVRSVMNVPLLVLLGLLIPAVYFFSVYDVLQSTDAINARFRRDPDKNNEELGGAREGSTYKQGIRASVLLISGGVVLFVIQQKPLWLEQIVQFYSVYVVAGAMLITALLWVLREVRRRYSRTGRFTAAMLLLGVAWLMVRDAWSGQDHMMLLLTWWPMVFICWGIEHLLIMIRNYMRQSGVRYRVRVDVKGLLLSMFIVFSVFAVSEQEQYMHLWNRVSLDLTSAGAEYSTAEGYRVEKPQMDIPIDLDTDRIVINGINGDIEVRKAEVEQVIVRYTVWIDQLESEEARKIAAVTSVEVDEGKSLGLSVKTKAYGESGRRQPRVDLTVILPAYRFLDLNITTTSGKIALTGVQAMRQIELQTGNGDLRLWNVVGDVSAKTLNGNAELYRIFGDVEVDTQGGNVKGRGITGKASLSTLVGDITLTEAQDDIQVKTKNGNIRIDSVPAGLQAESLNGKISISTGHVGGMWEVYSAVGELRIDLPEDGNYTLKGSSGYGDIFTEFPFVIENKEIYGLSGNGEFLLKIDGNSSLYVNKS